MFLNDAIETIESIQSPNGVWRKLSHSLCGFRCYFSLSVETMKMPTWLGHCSFSYINIFKNGLVVWVLCAVLSIGLRGVRPSI